MKMRMAEIITIWEKICVAGVFLSLIDINDYKNISRK